MSKLIKLTDEEATRLSIMLGYAVGAASREGHPDLRNVFMLLSGKVVNQLEEQRRADEQLPDDCLELDETIEERKENP